MNIEIKEDQRQAILLAIAKLSLERPGWDLYLEELSERFNGREMYEKFKDIHYDFMKELENL